MPIAVITGGNKGLGLYQTKRFVDAGYDVHAVARGTGELEQNAEAITFHQADLSGDDNAGWLSGVIKSIGKVDVLVNNAGMHLKKPIWDVAPDEFDQVLRLNVKAMFVACGVYVDHHRESGGAIVNIASMGGIMALPSAAAYVTAKTAVVGLTRSVAVDAAQFGIRCNAVSPGFIETDMTRAILARDPARRDKIEGRIPTHKFGTPQDVANAVFYLGSAEADYVNGVNLPVDGGYAVGF